MCKFTKFNHGGLEEPMPQELTIMLVDDQQNFRQELKLWLEEKLGHVVLDFPDGESALLAFQETPAKFDLVLADYYLTGSDIGNGIALLNRLKEFRDNIPVIIMTGGDDQDISRNALKAGAYWYLEKPIERVETEVLINSVGRWHVENQRVNQLREKTEAYYHPSLATLSQALFEESDFNVLVRTINQQASNFLEATNCQLILLDSDTGKIKNATDWQESNILFSTHYVKRLLTKELIENGGYHIVSDAAKEDGLNLKLLESGIKAFAGVSCPPKSGARAVLYVYFYSRLDPTGEIKLKANLVTLARLIGLAIERIRHEELTKVVLEAGQNLLSARSENDIYQIVSNTISQFQVSTFYLATFNETDNLISFPLVFDRGEKYETPDRKNTQEDGGLTGYIIREGKELSVNNLDKEPELPAVVKLVGDGTLPQAYFGVPLRLPNGKVVGAISIQRYAPRRFFGPSKQALRTLATLVASTIDRLTAEKINEGILAGLLNRLLIETLEEIAHEVQLATGADIVTVHPYDANRKTFTPERIRLGLIESEAKSRFYGSDIKALERLLQKDEHFSENSSTDRIFKSKFINEHKIISSGGITLKAGKPAYPIGVLVVNYKSPHLFNEESKEVIRYYARRAVLAVHMARLAQQERMTRVRTNAEHVAMNAIREFISPYTEEARIQMVKDSISAIESVWADTGIKIKPSILFSDLLKHKLVFAEEVIEKYPIDIPEQRGRKDIPFGEGICGWVAETGQSLLVSNVRKDTRYLELIGDTQSEICVPIKLGNRLLGVLDVESPQLNFFEDADRIFLERIAQEIAIAMGAAGHRKGADKVVQAGIEAAKDPDNALNILVRRAHEIANFADKNPNSTTLFLRIPGGLKPVAAYPEEILPRILEKIGPAIPLDVPAGQRKGIVVRTFIKGESQLVPDVQKDEDYMLFDINTKAELDIPIYSGVEVIGVLNVEYTNAKDLNAEDQLLLESLAAQTSFIAIIRRQGDDLAEKERQRSEATALALMGIASVDQGHRWKTAASTVAGTRDLLDIHLKKHWDGWRKQFASLLSKGNLGPDPNQIFIWLQRMERNIEVAKERPQNPSLPTENIEAIPVNEWLKGLLERWITLEENIQLALEFQTSNSDCIKANRFWLTRGVENLIANAIRHARLKEGEREPSVMFRSSRQGSMVQIEILDNGPGIPEKVRPYLFADVIPDGVGRIGHGVGCLTTQFIVRLYGGRAFLLKSDDQGTAVAIELSVERQ